MAGLFITAIDTNAGKSYASLYFLAQAREKGLKACYFKPIQCGKPTDASFISENIGVPTYCSYDLELPATPELAFQNANIAFDKEIILKQYQKLSQQYDLVIVEGAGGLYVPVWKGYRVSDLIKDLSLPTLIISTNKLGTINQTCLSIEFARAEGVQLIGFAFGPTPDKENQHSSVLKTNADFIESYTQCPYLGQIPLIATISHSS